MPKKINVDATKTATAIPVLPHQAMVQTLATPATP